MERSKSTSILVKIYSPSFGLQQVHSVPHLNVLFLLEVLANHGKLERVLCMKKIHAHLEKLQWSPYAFIVFKFVVHGCIFL
jgi:hypothetical protein